MNPKVKMSDRLLVLCGYCLLGLGVVLFVRLNLTGEGRPVLIMLLCMLPLLFFNLPAILQRRRDRAATNQTAVADEERGVSEE